MSDFLFLPDDDSCHDYFEGQSKWCEADGEPLLSLIRESADYVEVSRDLRASVIEAARVQCLPLTTNRLRLLGLGAAAAMGLTSVTFLLAQVDLSQAKRPLTQKTILSSSDELWLLAQSPSASTPPRSNTQNMPWHLVDAYQALRERQGAEMVADGQ